MQVRDVMQVLENLAPVHLKEEWDNVGLQLGHPEAAVGRVLLALTPSETVVEEAIRLGADMIVSHHPFIFKGVKTLRCDRTLGRMAEQCIKHDIALYCAHTNLDVALGGVNDVLAERLGLVKVEGLIETQAQPLHKLVVFVPETHLEQVKAALFSAGAGAQGAYSQCAWSVSGEGQFRPEAGAAPYLGTVGALTRVKEVRLEVLVEEDKLAAVLAAMQAAHPYESVAYDVFTDHASVQRAYLGRIGRLPAPQSLGAWLSVVKETLGLPVVSYAGDPERRVEHVALCGGSAAEFLTQAKAKGADVYVTGDVKYHDAQAALELGMALVDVSHYGGERPVLARLQEFLEKNLDESVQVSISEAENNFIHYLI